MTPIHKKSIFGKNVCEWKDMNVKDADREVCPGGVNAVKKKFFLVASSTTFACQPYTSWYSRFISRISRSDRLTLALAPPRLSIVAILRRLIIPSP